MRIHIRRLCNIYVSIPTYLNCFVFMWKCKLSTKKTFLQDIIQQFILIDIEFLNPIKSLKNCFPVTY